MSKPKAKKFSAKQLTPAPEQPVDVDPGADAPAEPVVTTPAADPVLAEAAEKIAKPVKVKKSVDQRNGITRPGPGKCLDVWTHLDKLIGAGMKPTFEELRKTIDPSTADATLRTQWARWRKHHNAEKKDGQ